MDEFASGKPCFFENSEPNSWPFILNDWRGGRFKYGEPQKIQVSFDTGTRNPPQNILLFQEVGGKIYGENDKVWVKSSLIDNNYYQISGFTEAKKMAQI